MTYLPWPSSWATLSAKVCLSLTLLWPWHYDLPSLVFFSNIFISLSVFVLDIVMTLTLWPTFPGLLLKHLHQPECVCPWHCYDLDIMTYLPWPSFQTSSSVWVCLSLTLLWPWHYDIPSLAFFSNIFISLSVFVLDIVMTLTLWHTFPGLLLKHLHQPECVCPWHWLLLQQTFMLLTQHFGLRHLLV